MLRIWTSQRQTHVRNHLRHCTYSTTDETHFGTDGMTLDSCTKLPPVLSDRCSIDGQQGQEVVIKTTTEHSQLSQTIIIIFIFFSVLSGTTLRREGRHRNLVKRQRKNIQESSGMPWLWNENHSLLCHYSAFACFILHFLKLFRQQQQRREPLPT